MDPIHPILPVPPNIPPVTEAPRVGKLTRDQRREPRQDKGRDEDSTSSQAEHDSEPGLTPDQSREPPPALRPGPGAPDAPGDAPRPHIDVTA